MIGVSSRYCHWRDASEQNFIKDGLNAPTVTEADNANTGQLKLVNKWVAGLQAPNFQRVTVALSILRLRLLAEVPHVDGVFG